MPLHWLPFLSQHHESTTTFRKERLPDDSCKEIKTWMCTYYLVALTFETHMDGNSALQVFAQSINWSFDLYVASVEKETQLLIVGKKARRKRASWQTVLHTLSVWSMRGQWHAGANWQLWRHGRSTGVLHSAINGGNERGETIKNEQSVDSLQNLWKKLHELQEGKEPSN